jgi:iron-sulfur cluster repair protein YtfE (RIC family)
MNEAEALAIVDQILDEHKEIHANFESLGAVSGDIEAAARLRSDKTKDYFVPKSLDDEGRGLARWQQILESIDIGLKAHFRKEETALSEAFQRKGTPELASALRQLLSEHDDINKHVAKLLNDAHDIASGGLRMEVWEGTGWGMKTNIERLQEKIAAHAESERQLLGKMKAHLTRH